MIVQVTSSANASRRDDRSPSPSPRRVCSSALLLASVMTKVAWTDCPRQDDWRSSSCYRLGSDAVARTMGTRCCRSGSWRRFGSRLGLARRGRSRGGCRPGGAGRLRRPAGRLCRHEVEPAARAEQAGAEAGNDVAAVVSEGRGRHRDEDVVCQEAHHAPRSADSQAWATFASASSVGEPATGGGSWPTVGGSRRCRPAGPV